MTDQELQALYRQILARRATEGQSREHCVTPEQLQALAEGSSSAEERLRWMDHVAGCPMCMNELALARATTEAAERLMPRTPQRAWLALAATIAALAVGAVLWRGMMPTREVMRGAAAPITLFRPAGNVPAPDAAQLVWASVPRAVRYEVEILDPGGNPAFAATVNDTMASVPSTTVLTPATEYRWRVSALLADGSRVRSLAQSFRIQTQ